MLTRAVARDRHPDCVWSLTSHNPEYLHWGQHVASAQLTGELESTLPLADLWSQLVTVNASYATMMSFCKASYLVAAITSQHIIPDEFLCELHILTRNDER